MTTASPAASIHDDAELGATADGIAAAITISLINYVILGFQFPVDGFYMRSFEVWLATTVVFYGSGNVGFTLLEYRLGEKSIVRVFHPQYEWRKSHGIRFQMGALLENIMWVPFLCVTLSSSAAVDVSDIGTYTVASSSLEGFPSRSHRRFSHTASRTT